MSCVSTIAKHLIPLMVALAIFMPSAAAQNRRTADVGQYAHETDPVRKARILSKLSRSQMDLAQEQLKSGDDVACLNTLQTYLDEAQQTVAGLLAIGVDAEKKPGGFKELQISLRETVRRVDDLILTLPPDKRPFFQSVRIGLVTVQNQLIDALFPRQRDRNSDKANP